MDIDYFDFMTKEHLKKDKLDFDNYAVFDYSHLESRAYLMNTNDFQNTFRGDLSQNEQ